MKRHIALLIAAVGFLAGCHWAQAGEMLDRIVATVNGHIILQSDWDDALRYEALVDGRALEQFPPAERKAALDRLIDQELLREQMGTSDLKHASQEEVARRIQEIRDRYPEAGSDEQWREVLSRYGFNQDELQRQVAQQLDLMRLVDVRLRPSVTIDSASIESYYNKELLPQLRQSGKSEVPLAEATPQIKELLTQQKMNQLLVAWLQNLRSGSEIQTQPGAESQGELR